MQYADMFSSVKIENFIGFFSLIFLLFFFSKHNRGYTLESPWRGGSNEYP